MHRTERSAGAVRSLCLGAALALLGLPAVHLPDARATRCAVPDLAPYQALVRPVPSMERAHGPGDPRTPPDDPNVGDSWLWYTWSLNGPPEPVLASCTVRGEGEHVYIVVEDSQWLTRVDQADVDAMIHAWDTGSIGPFPDKGIYELNEEHFGPVPDMLDQDPKIYVLYYDFDVSSDGFFWSFDMYPDGSQPYASNECEVLYMNSSEFDPGGDYLISVQAHEFHHMIHWLADSNEASWLNEGLAELAMWLYGRPDDVVAFPNAPDNSLTNFTGAFVDYVKVYLWSLYFYEHFGGQAAILDLVAEPLNGPAGVQQTLNDFGYGVTFGELVADWTTANYLDDPTLEGGRYNYAGEDLPPFFAVTRNAYPVPPTNTTVNHYAADYVKFVNGQPQELSFDGTDTSDWTARVIRYEAGVPTSVETMVLDSADAGVSYLHGFGTTYDQIVLMVANVSTTGGTGYSYATDAIPTSVDGSPSGEGPRLRLAGPNPFAHDTSLQLRLDAAGPVRATVHGADGSLLRVLAEGTFGAGPHTLRWDGRDERSRPVPAGAYWVRVAGPGAGPQTRRLTVAR